MHKSAPREPSLSPPDEQEMNPAEERWLDLAEKVARAVAEIIEARTDDLKSVSIGVNRSVLEDTEQAARRLMDALDECSEMVSRKIICDPITTIFREEVPQKDEVGI